MFLIHTFIYKQQKTKKQKKNKDIVIKKWLFIPKE